MSDSDEPLKDETFSADMLLIEELVDELGLDHWPADSETILEVGNLEDTRVLAIRHGLFTFETTSRGQRSITAAFNSARDARRYLIMDLGESVRFRTRMAPIVMNEPATGSELEEVPSGHRLTWPGGEATFYQRYEAVTFSWVIDADPATLAASYRHINGEPLFDLGIRAEAELVERPRGRVMDPPPIEVPPPDADDIDLVTIDAVLADHGWERRQPSGADVLVVGDTQVGRAIAYRQSQFVYESVVRPDYRNLLCTFSSAAAARRFMIMELSRLLRMRTRLPRIQLNRLAPGCAIEKGPTDFELAWPGGEGTFPIGYIGHQRALDFSWVALAELAEIAASYRHPNGEPLFDLSPPSQTTGP
jgi:hypothetical protein